MTSYRAWQEAKVPQHRYDETRVISVFPIDRGFLVTLRSNFMDKKKPTDTFGHTETSIFLTFEQANEIAHTLMTHIRSKQINQPDPPVPDDPVPEA